MGEVCGILMSFGSVVHEFRKTEGELTERCRRRDDYVQFDEVDCWRIVKNAWRWCYTWRELLEYSVLVRGGMKDTVCTWRRGMSSGRDGRQRLAPAGMADEVDDWEGGGR